MPTAGAHPWRALIAGARGAGPGDRPARRTVAGAAVATAAAVVLPLAGPQLIKAFVDGALDGRSTDQLVTIAALYLVVAVCGQAAAVLASFCASRLAWSFTNALRERVAEHALRLDLAFHAKRTAGEMIERVDGDVVGLNDFLSDFVVQAIGGLLLLAGAIVLVWHENAVIGLSFTVVVLLGGAVLGSAQRRVVPMAAALREAIAHEFGALEEAMTAADDLKANGGGPYAVGRFLDTCNDVYRAQFRWQVRGGGVIAGTTVLFAACTAVMIGVGVVMLERGAVTVGTVVLLFQYAQLIRRPVEQIVSQAKQLQEAGAAAARVAELLAERPALREPATPRALPPTGPLDVEMRGVTFSYLDDRPVLRSVDLRVPAGRSIGLVGRTGSGKTTIGRLLLRLYDVTEGSVRLAGVDVRDLSQQDLRRRVRMVTQDVQLFNGTVFDNVTLFGTGATDADVRAALAHVGLDGWVDRLPDGLGTELGAGGVGLSAGQAQLLAFARAFLTDPGLIVLDEASSRLDAATETLVSRATDELLRGRTAVIVAHRLASLDRVDDIAVVDGGRIIEHGERRALAADPDSHFAALLRAAGLAV